MKKLFKYFVSIFFMLFLVLPLFSCGEPSNSSSNENMSEEISAEKDDLISQLKQNKADYSAIESKYEDEIDRIEEIFGLELDDLLEELRNTDSDNDADRKRIQKEIDDLKAKHEADIKALNLKLENELVEIKNIISDLQNQIAALEKNVEYTVTFNSNNGSEAFSYKAKSGHYVTKPEDPVKKGYTFSGWFNDLGEKWVFGGYGVIEDTNLYAKYTPNNYKIYLDANKGKVETDVINVTYDAQFALPIPKLEHNSFVGWYKNETLVENGTYTFDSDITLKAKWALAEYTILYDTDGGTLTSANIVKVNYGFTVSLPTDISKDGYTFKGWYYEDTKLDNSFIYKYDTDIIIKAKWGPLFTITYDTYPFNLDIKPYEGYLINKVEKLPEINQEGATFLGWYYNDQLVEAPFEYTYTEDITLKAKWDLVDNGFKYELINENEITLLSYIGTDTNVIIPNQIIGRDLTSIKSSAFKDNKYVEKITLGKNVRTVEDNAFSNCISLKEIIFNEDLYNYGKGILLGCNNLTTIEFSNNYAKIISLFGNVESNIPESLEFIVLCKYALFSNFRLFDGIAYRNFIIYAKGFSDEPISFSNCSKVNSIIISKEINSISSYCFNGCENLKTVFYEGSEKTWNEKFNNLNDNLNVKFKKVFDFTINDKLYLNMGLSKAISELIQIKAYERKGLIQDFENKVDIKYEVVEGTNIIIKNNNAILMPSNNINSINKIKITATTKDGESISKIIDINPYGNSISLQVNKFNQSCGANEYVLLTKNQIIHDEKNEWDQSSNGGANYTWRTIIIVDKEGRIAYLVKFPGNGYGSPKSELYYANPYYSSKSYKENPVFTILPAYDGWNPNNDSYKKWKLSIPDGGFAVISHGTATQKIMDSLGINADISDSDFNNFNLLSGSEKLSYDVTNKKLCIYSAYSNSNVVKYVENEKYSYFVTDQNEILNFRILDETLGSLAFNEEFSKYKSISFMPTEILLHSIYFPLNFEKVHIPGSSLLSNVNVVFYEGTREQFEEVFKNYLNNNSFNEIVYNKKISNLTYNDLDDIKYLNIDDQEAYIIDFSSSENRFLNFNKSFQKFDKIIISENNIQKLSSLVAIQIGSNIRCIEMPSFKYFNDLRVIYYEGNEEQWNNLSIDKKEIPANVEIVFNSKINNLKYVYNNKYDYILRDNKYIDALLCYPNASNTINLVEDFKNYEIESITFGRSYFLDNVKYFIIPKSVNRIESTNNYNSTLTILYEGNYTSWTNINKLGYFYNVFYNCTSTDNIKTIDNEKYSYTIINDKDIYELNYKNSNQVYVNLLDEFKGCNIISIAASGFANNKNLISIIIPSTIVAIGYEAFYDCTKLVHVFYKGTQDQWDSINILPGNDCLLNSIIEIESKVNTFKLVRNKTYNYILTDNNLILDLKLSNKNVQSVNLVEDFKGYTILSIGAYGFKDTYSLKDIVLQDSIKSIAEQAFESSGLETINLPKELVLIKYAAFEYSQLKYVVIPNSVKNIEMQAFNSCNNLTNVYLSDSISRIQPLMFNNCNSLYSIIIPSSVITIGNDAFASCNNLKYVYYQGTQDQWNNINIDMANGANDYLLNANIEYNSKVNSMKEVKTTDYSYLVTNTNVIFELKCLNKQIVNADLVEEFKEYTIISLSDNAFSQCVELISANLPNTIIKVGSRTFEDCIKLKSVNIPNTITNITYHMFASCHELESIIIPDSVILIDTEAFYSCMILKEVYIPKALETIQYGAFINTSLNTVYYSGTKADFNNINVDEGNELLFTSKLIEVSGIGDVVI